MASTSSQRAVITVHRVDGSGTIIEGRAAERGQRVSFGECRTGCCSPNITVSGAAGHLTAYETHWAVANHSDAVPLLIVNPDRRNDRFVVPPRQGETTVPFDIAEITGASGHVLTVLGPGPERRRCHAPCAGDVPAAWGLNPATTHYAVMMALVAHVLDGADREPPTPADIAASLGITIDGVHGHVNHLIKRLGSEAPAPPRPRNWKINALITYARNRPFVQPGALHS